MDTEEGERKAANLQARGGRIIETALCITHLLLETASGSALATGTGTNLILGRSETEKEGDTLTATHRSTLHEVEEILTGEEGGEDPQRRGLHAAILLEGTPTGL